MYSIILLIVTTIASFMNISASEEYLEGQGLLFQMSDFRYPVDYPIRKIKIFIQHFAKVYLVRSIQKFNAPNCMVGELFMLCT